MEQSVRPPGQGTGPGFDLEDLVARRVLAWAGALAIVVGIAFLVAIAVDRGLVGPGGRVALAGAGSALLFAAGAWLYECKGRTQAALAAVGTGVSGFYLTLVGATQLYHLVPVPLALGLAAAIGLTTVVLALRWNSRTITALAIGGGLLAPVMVGAGSSDLAIAFELAVLAAAVLLLVWRRWEWLSVGAFVITAPQIVIWATGHPSPLVALLGLSAYCALNAAAALGYEMRRPLERLRASSVGLLLASSSLVAGCGFWALHGAGRDEVAGIWLAGLAVAHIALGIAALRSRRLSDDMGMVGLAAGVTLADAAFGVLGSGPMLTVGWALSATGMAALARRAGTRAQPVEIALAAQLSLAAIHTVTIDAPPSVVAGGGDQVAALIALAALGAGAFASARLERESGRLSALLDAVAMVTLLLATVTALDGAALVASWAAAAAVIGRSGRRDAIAVCGAAGFLTLAGGYGLTFSPPSALAYGVADLGQTALALGSIGAALLAIDLSGDDLERARTLVRSLAAGAFLYLASIAVVDVFQPGNGSLDTGLALGFAQQGQVALSTLWALIGATAFVVGLRRDERLVRLAGLGLLALAGGKVAVVDLATLDSIYRVMSFIGLGVLLLGSAFAYQRLRPEVAR